MILTDIHKKPSNAWNRYTSQILHLSKRCLDLITDSEYRSQKTMEILHKERVQQTTQYTLEDRYPEIFSACKDYLSNQNKESIRILSFGCCTGEEVVTLRKYFPHATIVGAELNRHSLKVCKSRECDKDIHFVYSKPENIQEFGPYDAVFCMAVLERLPHKVINEHITDLKALYPFDKFDKQIHEIDTYVKDNGLLIVHFTHYDLYDTDLAEKYSHYGTHGFIGVLFNKDSKLKKFREFHQSIFIKNKY